MDNTDTILECGLGFTCDFDKPNPFLGQEKVINQKQEIKANGGLRKRLASVLIDDPQPLLHHGEIVRRNGKSIAEIRSASYGHTLGGAVGLAMLEDEEPITKQYIETGEWEVEIADKRYPCKVSLRPFYDPKLLRVKL
jgi:4-methylaminobutanoate oxidase (formaldehyde-forming)